MGISISICLSSISFTPKFDLSGYSHSFAFNPYELSIPTKDRMVFHLYDEFGLSPDPKLSTPESIGTLAENHYPERVPSFGAGNRTGTGAGVAPR